MTTNQKKELVRHKKNNHNQMVRLLANFKNPTLKDVQYLWGIMKKLTKDNDGFARKQRTEIEALLSGIEKGLKQTKEGKPAQRTHEGVGLSIKIAPAKNEKKKPIVSTPRKVVEEKTLSTRQEIFAKYREKLSKLMVELKEDARTQTGGTSSRLFVAAKRLDLINKRLLRD